MARTKQNQRTAARVVVPMGATGGRTPPSKMTVALLSTSIVAGVWAAAMLTPVGRIAYVYLFAYSEFYMGVLALVSLSITVMLGLVATDRMVLSVRQRVLIQSAHRTTGTIAVGALVVHLMTKLSMGRIDIIDLFIPFLARNQTLYVGFGTLAAFLMVSVLVTGIVRARFIGRGKPWMWRAMHSLAYLSWPIATVHGLTVGRAAAGWVIASYIVCILFVLIGLAVRLSVSLGRRKNFSSTTGSITPVGKLVPTVSAGTKGRPKRRTERPIEVEVAPIAAHVVADRSNAPVAAVESWSAVQAAGAVAPVSARPAARRDEVDVAEFRPARSARRAEVAEDEYRPARSARRTEESGEPRRRTAEPVGRYADEEPVRSPRRYVEDDEPVAPRGRRYADEDDRYDEPSPRRPIAAELREPAPRQRWSADDEPVSRQSRSTEIKRYSPDPRGRDPRYPEQEEFVPGSRRHAEAAARYEPDPAPRPPRYADDVETAARSRRAPVDRVSADRAPAGRATVDYGYGRDLADTGRHSRPTRPEPADPWAADGGADPNYLPPDDTPTLIDMASRRARRVTAEVPQSRGAQRWARGEDPADELYFRQLRGEAQ